MDNPKVSVVIPIKNGGNLFEKVLQRILTQKTNFNYEVLLVDSGSSDGTLELVQREQKENNNLKLFEIPPKDFGHGKTRNYAISKVKAEFIALTTQDALPVDENWLQNLIDGFHNDPEIVGVFGKHIPYDNCYPVEKRQIREHFDVGFGKKWLKMKIIDKKDYKSRQGWYIFFSDNNACIRRKIWKKIPYRDVAMSEDQNWGKDILEAGYAKAYVPNAVVYHSHRYSLRNIKKRYYDEYKFHLSVGNVQRAGRKDFLRFFKNSYKYSLKTILIDKDLNIFEKLYYLFFYIIYDLYRSWGYYLGTNGSDEKDKKMSLQSEIINS